MVEAKTVYRTDYLSDQSLYNYLRKVFYKDGTFGNIKFAFNFYAICEELSKCIALDIYNKIYEEQTNWMTENFIISEKELGDISKELKQTLPNRLEKFLLEDKVEVSAWITSDFVPLIHYDAVSAKGPWYTLPDRI